MKIPFCRPFIIGKELYYIAEAVQSGSISGNGKYTRLCHEWLQSRLGTARALLTHSCTAALEMAAILANIQPGDEVIMPSFTFVSTANAFVLRGAVPVFVDIREDTLNIDESLIEGAITPRTRAIVPVHYAGLACAMDEIMATADRSGLVVIEDAAQALLSKHGNQYLGTIGHLGCLSFHETKNVISGEGGALLVNDPDMEPRAEIVWEKGTDRSRFFRGEVDKYTWMDIGSSYLPSELTAAFLYAQLEHADQIIAHRRHIMEMYFHRLCLLEADGKIRMPNLEQCSSGNGHNFFIRVANLDERDRLIAHLRSRDIHAAFHYVPLHESPAGKKYGRTSGALPVTSRAAEKLIRLPLFFEITEQEIDRVATGVRGYFGYL